MTPIVIGQHGQKSLLRPDERGRSPQMRRPRSVKAKDLLFLE